MYFKEIAYTLKETITLDDKYRPVVNYSTGLFYCNEKDVGMNEFYQSASVGLKPEIKLQAKLLDLKGVSHIKYKNKIYKLLRTYKKEDLIDLVLTSTIIENSIGSLGE